MIDTPKYQSMADATWPVFERKWRRARLLQKVKKYVPWLGALLAVCFVVIWNETPEKPKMVTPEKPALIKHQTPTKVQQLLSPIEDPIKGVGVFSTDKQFIPIFNYEFGMPTKRSSIHLPESVLMNRRADLILACAQLNFQPQTWSIQANGYSLSALLDDQTLVIMNLNDGTDALPALPIDFNNESDYRPSFFPSDQFVHIAFYEVGDWIQDPLTVRLTMNRISDKTRIAPWLISANSIKNFDGSDLVITAFDREQPGMFVYRGLNPNFYRSSSQQYRKNLFIADRPAEAFNPLLFHHADTLVVISAQAQRLTKLSMNGVLYTSKEISFLNSGIHSLKRLEPILDPVSNELYVLAPTNFHFIIYKVDLKSAVAKEVYQTSSVWKGAEFEIEAGILTYIYKGQQIVVELP